MQQDLWTFSSAGRLVFGCGMAGRIGELVRQLRAQRVLIVSDEELVAAGAVAKITDPLRKAGIACEVFSGGEPEPSFACADAAIAVAREARPDAIIGLGGGSNMDLAKITAAVVTHGDSYRDYFGFDRVPGPVLPLVCVPTTSGTGSEVSHAAVLTDADNGTKVSTLSIHLRPRAALVDPELTLTCPPRATAHSGIDALTHAVEAYTATRAADLEPALALSSPYSGKYPLTDLLAGEAIRLIARHLVQAVDEPNNIEARTGMSLGATLAGLAFSNAAVALVHAMEYPLGGTLHCSHGEGNGLLLPHVMAFYRDERIDELAQIAAWMGEDVEALTRKEAADAAIAAVDRLRERIGVRGRIRDLGGREDQLAGFAEKAHAIGRLMVLTPRSVTPEDIVAIYRAAL